MNFIRVFSNEVEARNFAAAHNSKVVVSYNWDHYYGLIKEFTVQF